MAGRKAAVAEPLVQEMNERVAAAATAAGKECKTGAGIDLLTEAGMEHGHLELEALLAGTAPLVVLADPVCPGYLELGVVGSKQWLG